MVILCWLLWSLQCHECPHHDGHGCRGGGPPPPRVSHLHILIPPSRAGHWTLPHNDTLTTGVSPLCLQSPEILKTLQMSYRPTLGSHKQKNLQKLTLSLLLLKKKSTDKRQLIKVSPPCVSVRVYTPLILCCCLSPRAPCDDVRSLASAPRSSE